jgi:hypothetical protein
LYVLATLEYVASVFLEYVAESHMKRKISYRKITPKISQKNRKKVKMERRFALILKWRVFILRTKEPRGFR